MAPDGFLNIDTPENVVFDMEIAGIGSRFMAALVDTLLIGILQVAIFLPLVLSSGESLGESVAAGWLVAAAVFLAFIILWGYYIFFEWRWNGQTPGKRLVGVRVICADGRPITLTEALIRNLVRLIDFLPGFYGIGVVVMFAQRHWRRLGDLAAGTLVVFDQKPVKLESLGRERRHDVIAREDANTGEEWLPVERLTAEDIQRVEEFLDRWTALTDPGHAANAILRSLSARMELPPPQEMSSTQAISQFRRILAQWHAKQ